MSVARRVSVLLLSATFLFAAPRIQLLSDYGAVRQRLDSRYSDWKQASQSADFPVTLNRAWSLVGDWAIGFFEFAP